jgi:hypothetical protein
MSISQETCELNTQSKLVAQLSWELLDAIDVSITGIHFHWLDIYNFLPILFYQLFDYFITLHQKSAGSSPIYYLFYLTPFSDSLKIFILNRTEKIWH